MKVRLFILMASLLVGAVVGWLLWVNGRIEYYAHLDEARPADAIAIFGAAEYDGRPSPVFRARLDHGLALYRQGFAPMIVTLGGGAEEDNHSEGGVGMIICWRTEFPRAGSLPRRRAAIQRSRSSGLA